MQFVVPQFIEVEAKIIGPISVRQFIILMVMVIVDFLLFKLFPPIIFLPSIILLSMFGFALAFATINGQAMHFVLLNLIQTLRRPRIRIWARTEYVERDEEDDDAPTRVAYTPKHQVSSSHLAAMSLVVDTGGSYAPDDVRQAGASASIMPPAPKQKDVNLK